MGDEEVPTLYRESAGERLVTCGVMPWHQDTQQGGGGDTANGFKRVLKLLSGGKHSRSCHIHAANERKLICMLPT